MCKPHDQFHYPRDLREAASLLACGNPDDRDKLLAAATHNGLAQIMEDEVECMPLSIALAAVTLLKRHWRLNVEDSAALKLRCHERWDDELESQLAALAADQVD